MSFYLQISSETINRYIQKFINLGNVSTAIIGRLYYCISMHPHEELVIMELLQYPDKTIAKVLHEVYEETESQYACVLHCSLLFEKKTT